MKTARSSTCFAMGFLLMALAGCAGSEGAGKQSGSAATTAAAAQGGSSRRGVSDPPTADAVAVRAAPVRREPLSSLYSTSASLRADRRATITARTRGVIRKLLVEEGDTVAESQELAALENDEQRIALSRAVTTRDTLLRDLERSRNLHEEGLVSDEDFEDVRRRSQDAMQGAALAELELSRTMIRAPFAGVIVRRYLDVGATVADGSEVYDLADLSPLYADVEVPERHVISLAPGQAVRLIADALDRVIPAVIERIAPAVDPETGTVKVTLAIEGTANVRPGAFVRVNIVVETHQDALVVPRLALVAEGTRWYLFRLEDDNTVHRLEVTLGFEEGDRVEVLRVVSEDEDLSPGTQVIVSGAPALTDGAPVNVVASPDEDSDGDSSAAL
ncbi:MAG: efflux RND transporter periplasmic adaptor subunit [Acidobacteria bacterium]|nr:efflux RND transporter periplasmic adaptor subunit [Acidobacteriota bacterium]